MPRKGISVAAFICVVSTTICASFANPLAESIRLPSVGIILYAPSIIAVRISQGIDDGYRWVINGSYNVDRGGVCYDSGKNYILGKQMIADSWWLFRAVDIPQGAQILSAKLAFTASANQRGHICSTKILAEAEDDATPVAGDYREGWDDYESRRKTLAAIPWHDIPDWSRGGRYESPDISPVIQEIVSRPGWTPGNAIQIFWMDDGSSEGIEQALRSAAGYEYPLAPGTGEYAAELEVTYESVTG